MSNAKESKKFITFLGYLTKPAVIKALGEEKAIHDEKHVPEDSALDKAMEKYYNDYTYDKPRKGLEQVIIDRVPFLNKQTAPGAFAMLNDLIATLWGRSNAKALMTRIRKAVPAAATWKTHAMTTMRMDQEEEKKHAKSYEKKIEENQSNQITIDPKKVFEIQTKLSQSSNTYDIVAACMLASGSRFIEILSPTYKFTKDAKNPGYIIQQGVSKGYNEAKEINLAKLVSKPVVGEPTHMDVPKFLDFIKTIRANLDVSSGTNEQITARYNAGANARVRVALKDLDLGDLKKTTHTLRKLYTLMSYELVGKGTNESLASWSMKVLGHSTLKEQLIYTRFKLERKSTPELEAAVAQIRDAVENIQEQVQEIKETGVSPAQSRLATLQKHRDGTKNKAWRAVDVMMGARAAGIAITERNMKKLHIGSRLYKALRDEGWIQAINEQEK